VEEEEAGFEEAAFDSAIWKALAWKCSNTMKKFEKLFWKLAKTECIASVF
jgi:hypothetical protein